ncbi:MAG: FIST C-terminal domain-containing protein [Planctomycetota bacterium]|nr:FIST C-terminal domain-containing protein [Planctomycetota bacterium]MDA1215102.1 FIST C-terminal domain-containing protein [Planctomycetota bacterium]
MTCTAFLSRLVDSLSAAREAAEQIISQLKGQVPDLTCLFLSHHHVEHLDEIVRLLVETLGSRVTIGCTGETIIGAGEEIENGPALSVWSAVLPEADLRPFRVTFEETPDGLVCTGIPEIDDDLKAKATSLLLFGEPFTCDARVIIDLFENELPNVPIVGGMASGGSGPGQNRLVFAITESEHAADTVVEQGAVGVLLCGGPRLRTVVSQGCKPIGKPFVVTKAEKNLVFELGGQPPLAQLQLFFNDLTSTDQALVRKGLHLGIAMSEYRDQFGMGDFLISNVIGVDPDKGVIAIGNRVRVGQTVQFHVRDAETADAELKHLLERERDRQSVSPQGILIFSCNGRGTRLFPEPNHDAEALQSIIGAIPAAGFFAQGELGPVGGKNYIHGYTASVALFD